MFFIVTCLRTAQALYWLQEVIGMYQAKLEKDIRCPLEYGLEVFGGKWKSRILCVLAAKEVLRYSQLRKEMGNITDAVLAAALKELLAAQMVSRASYDEIPPRVEYSLTDKGPKAFRGNQLKSAALISSYNSFSCCFIISSVNFV